MRVAVIGAGIAGLGAAWALRDHSEVTVFEKASRLGGHSHTITVHEENAASTEVDTGFIVYNTATYPNLIALFDQLNVPSIESDMSFAVSLDNGMVEYSSDSLAKLFGHTGNYFRPSHWRMVLDLTRFYRNADRLCAAPLTQTLGDYLLVEKYSTAFRDLHLLPMAAAIWSSSPERILNFPARSFGHFFRNHGLMELDIKKRPPWRTVAGGSKVYVEALVRDSRATVVLDAKISSVEGGEAPTLVFTDGTHMEFDQVIIATHADEALALLEAPTTAQQMVLAGFSYAENRTYLHQDIALMPQRRRLWASWNYLRTDNMITVTYWMNRLQSLTSRDPLLVSLNPPHAPNKIFAEMIYTHPQFDQATLAAQTRLKTIQGKEGLWFCGSYCGYGFHEDALASGLAVAEALGAKRSWKIDDVSPAFANASPQPA